ncbi:MAG: NERD domain-containing protein [Lachnospiraceae bacterium]|nr:NERD domain-containing protein [Lachnospiraceae bacterium]
MRSFLESVFWILLIIGLLLLFGSILVAAICALFKRISDTGTHKPSSPTSAPKFKFPKLDFLWDYESPEKKAGRMGEQFANQVIREILRESDVSFANVKISAEGKQCEIDNLIINNRGVFIIEVKNYVGEVYGTEEDPEWIKNKISPGGYFSQVTVKNPIKQVKRQTFILSRYLKAYGIDVWIEGYVFFVNMNSPVESKYVLRTQKDIDNAIHYGYNNNLRSDVKEKIVELLR